MPMTWMLILAITLGCTQPASTSRSGFAQSAPLPPPGNVVQPEMRMLTSILEATVRAIGARDVRPIAQELHRLHAAKEATTATLRDGSYKLPKNHDQIDAFVAMDEAFHEHLGALVSSSRANDLPRTCCSDGVQAVAASYASGAHVSAR